jgi:hypothetical protein
MVNFHSATKQKDARDIPISPASGRQIALSSSTCAGGKVFAPCARALSKDWRFAGSQMLCSTLIPWNATGRLCTHAGAKGKIFRNSSYGICWFLVQTSMGTGG